LFHSESGMRRINNDNNTDYCGALHRTDVREWIWRYYDLQRQWCWEKCYDIKITAAKERGN